MSISGSILAIQWAAKQEEISADEAKEAILQQIKNEAARYAKSFVTEGGDIFSLMKADMGSTYKIADRSLRRIIATAEAEAKAEFYNSSKNKMFLKPASKDIDSKLQEFEEMIKSWGDTPVLFGIYELDDCFGGLYPGELCVVNGAPGGMKTSLALNAMSHFISHDMGKVLYVSVDMSPEEIYFRLVLRECMDIYSERELRQLIVQQSGDYERAKYSMIEKYGKYLVCEGHNSKDRIDIDKLRYLIGIHMPDLVIIDYLTMLDKGMTLDDLKFVNTAMPQIHGIAKDLAIPFIILSQMSRASRTAQAGGTMGGHAKGGGIVEELAVVEIELRREEQEGGQKPEIYATVTKTRRGIAGRTFRLDYRGNSMRFTGKAEEAERVSARKNVFQVKGGTY